jgi:hypothetical protein
MRRAALLLVLSAGCMHHARWSDLPIGVRAPRGPFHPWGTRQEATTWLTAHQWGDPTRIDARTDEWVRADGNRLVVQFDRNDDLEGVVVYERRANEGEAAVRAIDVGNLIAIDYGEPMTTVNHREIWALPTATEELGVAAVGRFVVITYRVDLDGSGATAKR